MDKRAAKMTVMGRTTTKVKKGVTTMAKVTIYGTTMAIMKRVVTTPPL